jgi:streptomycin 6-kinase
MATVIPTVVRNKALAHGAGEWLDRLPGLIAELASAWDLQVGAAFPDATEAFVAPVEMGTGRGAVLKVLVPRDGGAAAREITALRLAAGAGCAELLRADRERNAILLERLGPSLHDLGVPAGTRHTILCDAAAGFWTPAPECGLPTGAEKAVWLADHITTAWHRLGRPCSAAAVEHALACAARRRDAHDEARSVLVHGDVHQWNALRSAHGFKLVDPDGLHAEPEYDLGIVMREDPVELMADGDPWRRAHRLAERTGLDPVAIFEWGVVERVSTGLLAETVGLQPVGRQMLAAAEWIAAQAAENEPEGKARRRAAR